MRIKIKVSETCIISVDDDKLNKGKTKIKRFANLFKIKFFHSDFHKI